MTGFTRARTPKAAVSKYSSCPGFTWRLSCRAKHCRCAMDEVVGLSAVAGAGRERDAAVMVVIAASAVSGAVAALGACNVIPAGGGSQRRRFNFT